MNAYTQQEAVDRWNNRRVHGMINWLDSEIAKFDQATPCVANEITLKTLKRCKKQLTKLLEGLGL